MDSLSILQEKALIKIDENDRIWMHDLIEEMGKKFVQQQSPDDAGKRSRLWLYEDIRDVLEEKKGTDQIKGIVLRYPSEKIQLKDESFTNMKNLQILSLGYGCKLHGENVNYLPTELRYLKWMNFELRSLPLSFNLRKIGILNMSGPGATQLVNDKLKDMPCLISIHLDSCEGLTSIPDLSRFTRLKELLISDCDDLVDVHPSVGRLDKLVSLTICLCAKLEVFQERLTSLKSLVILNLSNCPLKFFPEIEGDMKCLKSLCLSGTDIEELPRSIGNLTGLQTLFLNECIYLTDIPESIFYELHSLEQLDLRGCSKLVTFPTKSESLVPPVSPTTLTRLHVNLSRCYSLEEVSEFPLEIHELNVSWCKSLERISKLSKILGGKDSKMFGELYLTHCGRLCSNLPSEVASEVEVDKRLLHQAKKMTSSQFTSAEELIGDQEEAEQLEDLWALFLSCVKSEEFIVEFPLRFDFDVVIPNWFTCRTEVYFDMDRDDIEIWDGIGALVETEHELHVEIPQNCKGMALCIQSHVDDDFVDSVYSINGIEFGAVSTHKDHGWVHYIPLVTVRRRLSECGIPPPDDDDMFRVTVMFRFKYEGRRCRVSLGVHLIEEGQR